MAAELLLSRLERVRKTGSGRWVARCPAHEDREPSLSVRECDDGTVLIKCFAGCGATDVVEAAGLRLSDLFPPRQAASLATRAATHRPSIPWEDVVRSIRHHLLAIGLAADDLARGTGLSREDAASLARAARFVLRIIEEVRDVR